MGKRRADTLLAERGLAPSRTSAAASIRAGSVRIGGDGPRLAKPSELIEEGQELVVDAPPRFVSRGGVKLANALEALPVSVEGRSCLDVGASTGGFTDCLLGRGARRVIALDVAYGQLAWRLRNDPRVEVIERANARHLDPARLPFAPDLVTVDVAFISLAKLAPALARCLAPGGEVLALVKPQFELGRGRVGRGGVIRSVDDRREAILAAAGALRATGLHVLGFAPSGLPGPKGNRETFIWAAAATREPSGRSEIADLAAAVAELDA